MNLTTLVNLLSQAPDVSNRSFFYRDKLHDQLHPFFFELIAAFESGNIVFENNPKLNEISIYLDELFLKMNEDLEPIGGIITQLGKAGSTLQIAPDDYSELPTVLQTIDALQSETAGVYDHALAFYAEQLLMNEKRLQFTIGNPESPRYNFVMDFDTQLERDMLMVQFLRDTLLSYSDKLKALRSKIGQSIASNNTPPPVDIAPIVSLLNQSVVITTRVTQIVEILQEARTKLSDLGQGLIAGEINIQSDPDLNQTKLALDELIAAAPDESMTHDALLNQLTEAATGFTTTPENPELPAAISVAGMRRQEAKIVKEEAHLLKIAFSGLDTFSKQLDSMEANTEERAFYSEYRRTIDKFHLLTLYIDGTCGKFELSTNQLWSDFSYFLSDQRNKVQLFDDKLPFALLPVRLETRFMTIKHVRDNISYASTNDVLRSDQDAQGIKAVKEQNTLMESSDPKGGLELQSAPVMEGVPDKHELWVRIYPDNIAIHNHEDQLSQSELNDAQIYWNENWKAAGIPVYELGAWRPLCSSYGSQRAAWIISQTIPTNGLSKPPNATGTPPQPLSSLTPFPVLPTLTPRPASWSKQPHTKVMPERFVARVYSNNTWREIVGQKVPSPLPVGFDPLDPYANYLDQNGTEINMPPDLRWLTDFGEAEKVGMGIRIPLQTHEIGVGFDRLLVLGLKLDLDATAAAQELETLLNNHHYSTGLALVPQGTPTNNTDEAKSGFAGIEPGYEESFVTELGSNLFTTTASHYDKADGQRLAEALGLNPSVFQHVANSNTQDVQESMTMTKALWPATLGYYLKNMLTPSLVQSYIGDTRTFFTNYVLGRGLIPAFRVRNQPYGVLTSTVYSKWKYSDSFSYDAKLHSNILEKLRKYWKLNFFNKIKHIGEPPTVPPTPSNELLVNILGLHPSSVQFHQRITVGSLLASNIAQFLNAANMPQPNPAIANPTMANLLDALYQSYLMENFSYFNTPRIFSMAFSKSHRLLNGPVIDSLPLSEKRIIEKLGNGTANYIEWLAGSTITRIRQENFSNVSSVAVQPPKALLYLLLRHAWMLEYLDTAHCLLTSVNAISQDSWHNHELLRMTGETGPLAATEEQKSMLHGFVKAEVQFENELQIEDVMRNLSSNQQYLSSGMTPEQFHLFLRDQSMPVVESRTAIRYEERLNEYHVDQGQWSYLLNTYEELSAELSVADHIRANLNSGLPCYTKLKEAYEAFTKLKTLPTARLERCLAEHLDTCAYRLDSWLNGLVNKRLLEQRSATPGGIYLGAYGILEKLKPNLGFPGIHVVNLSNADSWNSAVASKGQRKMLDLTSADKYPANTNGTFITNPVPATQPASFIYLGGDRTTHLIEDPESGKIVSGQQFNPENNGFILAPSLNHAVASAVMRAGYAAHTASGGTAQAMAVTLSSDRVRTAMYYLDGVRHGQNLAALLGYQFERGLHERQVTASPLDGYIAELREEFPLVSGTVTNTPQGQNNNGQTRHVTDGLKLLQAYSKVTPVWYANIPGIHNGTAYTADGAKIVVEVEKIKGDLDAIGDLLLSEAIYQVTRGNHERAGSVLQALGYGGNIPEPEIIKTPRQTDTFTHRCAVQFTPATAANGSWTGTSVRATAEPALNNWLASQLPSPLDICIVYDYAGNTATPPLWVNMNGLGLQPIDLLTIFTASGSNQSVDATELSKRIINYARTTHTLADTVDVTISYGSNAGSARNIFELTPILQSLSRIVGNSRMLNPDDFVTPGALAAMSSPAGALDSGALYSRMLAARTSLQTVVNTLTTDQTNASGTSFTSTQLNTLRSSLISAAQFGVSNAIPDTISTTTIEVRKALVDQATSTLSELNKRLTATGTKLTAVFNALNPTPAVPITPDVHKVQVTALGEIAKLLFGRSFKVFTNFTLHNLTEVQNASNYTTLLSDAGPFPVEAWMAGVARVRPRMGEYHKQMVLAESVRYNPAATAAFEYTKQSVFQFPVVDTNTNGADRWIGMKLPATYKIPLDAISMVIESDGTSSTIPTCGMVIDEWPEQIPIDKVTAGIAINYDQPSSEAPQNILLAITPEIKSYWLWDDLMDTLNETIEMAQIRAVEPDMIQDSPLSQVLPALVAQMNGDGSNASPSLDFARNIVSVPNGFDDPVNISTY